MSEQLCTPDRLCQDCRVVQRYRTEAKMEQQEHNVYLAPASVIDRREVRVIATDGDGDHECMVYMKRDAAVHNQPYQVVAVVFDHVRRERGDEWPASWPDWFRWWVNQRVPDAWSQ